MAEGSQRNYPNVSVAGAGLACKCPRCGRGRLYEGFLTVAERCSVCGLDLRKADSGDGPAIFLIFILGALVVPMALLVEAAFSPPMWLHMTVWSVVILGAALAMLRPMKGIMIALQYKHRASDSGLESYDQD